LRRGVWWQHKHREFSWWGRGRALCLFLDVLGRLFGIGHHGLCRRLGRGLCLSSMKVKLESLARGGVMTMTHGGGFSSR
jgi:hypothetical protein